MTDNQSFSVPQYWQDKLIAFHDEHVPDKRLQVRLQGEQEARTLLEEKPGQLDKGEMKDLLESLSKDLWRDKINKARFKPAFWGFMIEWLIDPVEPVNKWAKLLWEAEDSQIDELLDDFWRKNEVSGAGISFPTAILYLRDPEKYAVWIPALESGLKTIGILKPGKRRTAEGYRRYNRQFQSLRETMGFSPQSMDIILTLAGRETAGVKDKHSFETLFQEFVTTHPDTPEGQAHLQNYQSSRRTARENWQALIAKQEKGEQITDFLLLKCLPHGDTKPNRERGAWIHPAPAVTKDVRQWFEGAKWADPKDWPVIAEIISEFYNRCYHTPDKLTEHCQYFLDTCPAKGFQMGILTPMLNAIAPEHYVIVNTKPRQVINYFSKKKFTNNLLQYPDINQAIFSFIKNREDLFAELTDENVLESDVFDLFCHWLVAIKKFSFPKGRVYKVAPDKDEKQWEQWVAEGYASIGGDVIGDLSALNKSDFEKKRNELVAAHSDLTKGALNLIWRFSNIREDDRIIANNGKKEILGIGTVMGPYYFVPNTEHGHRLPVMWDDLTRRKVDEPDWDITLQRINLSRFEELKIAPPIEEDKGGGSPEDDVISERNPIYSIEDCAKDTGFDEVDLKCWINGINRKKQAVIYGPPGTGKTYVADLIADHLIGGGYGFKKLVQFHPEYAYQDFMQGIRPVTKDGVLRYDMIPGVFYNFCREAEEVRDGGCVLIIDEINRANLSRVFGELMYLLEYREESVALPGGGTFSIPHNVRIIGTMNTADRSIALVDYALRRRFAFLKLAPKYEILEKFHEETGFDTGKLIQILKDINTQIDDTNYELGISFFLTEDLEDQIEDIWRMEIEPYLEEYFFDDQDKFEMFSWEKIQPKLQ